MRREGGGAHCDPLPSPKPLEIFPLVFAGFKTHSGIRTFDITFQNLKVVNNNYADYYKRKVSDALYIKQTIPFLNIRDISVPL